MNVPHLTVYFDPKLGCVVDDEHPDNSDSTRNPGGSGARFDNPDRAGEYIADYLRRMQFACQLKEAEAEKQARSAHFRVELKAYGDCQR